MTRPLVRLASACLLTAFAVSSLGLCWMPEAATADPGIPSTDQIRSAQRAAAGKAAEVSRLEAELAASSAKADASDVALGLAAEAYDKAEIDREALRRQAVATSTNARQAAAAQSRARIAVGRLASQLYRGSGTSLGGAVDMLFSPGGPQDVLERDALEQNLSDQRRRVLQRLQAAQQVSALLDRQAQASLAAENAAAAQLASVRKRAEAASALARTQLTAQQVERTRLLAELASLQQSTVALVRQREAGLEAARRAAAAAAAAKRAADQARAARLRNRPPVGSGPGDPPAAGTSRGSAADGLTAVAWARRQLGLPYQWGGAGPDSYDCSGLTMRAWEQAGVALPHYAASQYDLSAKVAYGQLRPGDLIFYATDTGDLATIHHVTMYVGDGQMIEAPQTGLDVRIVPIRWDGAMPWAGRP